MSSSPSTIEIDRSHDGETIRKAFAIEAFFNLLSLPVITHPRAVLSFLLLDSRQVNPASILFAKLFTGVVVGALTTGLLYSYRNTKKAIESRRSIYWILGMGEAVLLPILVSEYLKGGGRDAAISPRAALGAICCLLPPLLWRFYALFVHPEMMGRYKEMKRD